MAYPTLNQNKIFSALYNQIISIDTFADNIAENYGDIVDAARVDGTLYGDTKVYLATDCLESYEWDPDDTNVLEIKKPKAPETQTITIDKFRQIAVTVDQYLTKQAFATEGAFSQFNSAILAWIQDTKRVHDKTNYNAFIGTAKGQTPGQSVSIALSDITATGEEKNRLEGGMIAEAIANLIVNLKDTTRDYNDYGFLRSYDEGSIKVIWNTKFVNKIKKLDLPTVFHKEGLIDKMDEYVLPARFFGSVNANETQGNGTTVRSLIEQKIGSNHYFAGDLIKASDKAPAGTSYTEDATVICKVVVKLPPYMSAFETGTEFFNGKALRSNHYLTFGRNTLAYLKNYPMITVSAD